MGTVRQEWNGLSRWSLLFIISLAPKVTTFSSKIDVVSSSSQCLLQLHPKSFECNDDEACWLPCTESLFGSLVPSTATIRFNTSNSFDPTSSMSSKFAIVVPPEAFHGCADDNDTLVRGRSTMEDRALLLPRGHCSFYAKASIAARDGFRLLIISDTDSSKSGSSVFVPTIAEWDDEILLNLTIISVSHRIGQTLRKLAKQSVASSLEEPIMRAQNFAPEPAGLETITASLVALSTSANSRYHLEFVACLRRTDALFARGLISSAVSALSSCRKYALVTPETIKLDILASIEGIVNRLLETNFVDDAQYWARFLLNVSSFSYGKTCSAYYNMTTDDIDNISFDDFEMERTIAEYAVLGAQALLRAGSLRDASNALTYCRQQLLCTLHKLELAPSTSTCTSANLRRILALVDARQALLYFIGIPENKEQDEHGGWLLYAAEEWHTASSVYRQIVAATNAEDSSLCFSNEMPLTIREALQKYSAADAPIARHSTKIEFWLIVTLIEEVTDTIIKQQPQDMVHQEQKRRCLDSRLRSSLWRPFVHNEEENRFTSECCKLSADIQLQLSHGLEILQDVHVMLALFLDEVGFFSQAIAHFMAAAELAARSCDHGAALALRIRAMTAAPVIAVSSTAIVNQRVSATQLLEKQIARYYFGVQKLVNGFYSPFDDPTLAYTITPATMMVGYQGIGALLVPFTKYEALADHQYLRRLSRFYDIVTPTISQVPKATGTKEKIGSTPRNNSRLRVGFVSSFLRKHSVGRLMTGVISRLDKNRIETHGFFASHFFIYNTNETDDEISSELYRTLEYVHILPRPDRRKRRAARLAQTTSNLFPLEDMARIIASSQLDILVYPELGMDALMLLLARERFAPIQCVFWGHPISQGVASIDYFLSSDFFEIDEASFTSNSNAFSSQSFYGEQIIRMEGLSTFFPKPQRNQDVKLASSMASTRRKLGLPSDAHIYLVPQTLMKFHPTFDDDALVPILLRDAKAFILIPFNPSQSVWQAQLQQRLNAALRSRMKDSRTILPRAFSRVRFFPTLPHDEFLVLLRFADVVLDPFPFGGGVTTLEALSMGTPVITLPIRQTVVRLAAGFMRKIGLASPVLANLTIPLVVASIEDYVTSALRIATGGRSVGSIRTQLEDKIFSACEHYGLFDDESAAKEWTEVLLRLGNYKNQTMERYLSAEYDHCASRAPMWSQASANPSHAWILSRSTLEHAVEFLARDNIELFGIPAASLERQLNNTLPKETRSMPGVCVAWRESTETKDEHIRESERQEDRGTWTSNITFPIRSAEFGLRLRPRPFPNLFGGKLSILAPNESSGCKSFRDQKNEIKDTVVLVRRGNCSFATKARVAMEAGAKGILVANYANDITLMPMSADESFFNIYVANLHHNYSLILQKGGFNKVECFLEVERQWTAAFESWKELIAIDFLEQEKMTKAKISGVPWEYDQKADLATTKLRQEAYRPVYQLIAPHIQSILIAAAFGARKNAALVGGSSHSTSTSRNYDGQSKNVRLVVLVFYGRREMFQITHIYLEMNLRANGGIVDEVRLVPNTNNTDDLNYMHQLLRQHTWYRLSNEGSYSDLWERENALYGRFYAGISYSNDANNEVDQAHAQTVFVKLDDDIVYISENAFEALVEVKLHVSRQAKRGTPQILFVAANVINHPRLSHRHQAAGLIRPFQILSMHETPDAKYKAIEMDSNKSCFAENSRRENTCNFSDHPFGRTELGDWRCAAGIHESFLADIAANNTNRWSSEIRGTKQCTYNAKWNCIDAFVPVSVSNGGTTTRWSINAFALEAADLSAINKTSLAAQFLLDDEQFLSEIYPLHLGGRRSIVATEAIMVHYSYRMQLQGWQEKSTKNKTLSSNAEIGGLDYHAGDDILQRYLAIAKHKVALMTSNGERINNR